MIPDLPPLPLSVNAAHCPNWTIERADHRSCPVCRSEVSYPIVRRPDKFVVHKCINCGMIYLADIPCQEEIRNLYKEYGEYKKYKTSCNNMSWPKLEIASRRNYFINILENTGGIKGNSVCEIGCSYGRFLDLVRHRGGEVHGVELDINARHFLEGKNISVSEEMPADQRFGIICLFQVLEHLVDPSEVLSVVSESLTPDGRVLISIPNGGEYKKIGSAWVGFRVDLEHLNYFDLQSLSELLSQYGLFIEHYWEHLQPNIARDTDSQERLLKVGKRIIKKLGTFIRGSFDNENILDKGSFVLTIIARKASLFNGQC